MDNDTITPVTHGTPVASGTTAASGADGVGDPTIELIDDELLVEEISIDGMCGVY